MSELASVAPDVLDESMKVVSSLFKSHRFCHAIRYNIKRITINKRYAGGAGQTGTMEWEIKVQPTEALYTLNAYVDIAWDDDMIKIPAVFKDHRGNARGFSDISIRRFLYAGVDLTDYIPPMMPRL